MNPIDDQLSRLFRAAAGTPAAGPSNVDAANPPYGMESRVLAAWREAGNLPAGFWDMGLLVRGLIVATVLMALSVWPALQSQSGNPDTDYQQLADLTVQVDSSP